MSFIFVLLSGISFAQVYLRTETVNSFPVQIYGATVVVKIHGSHPADLEKAKAERQAQYVKIEILASELARSRISSMTTIEDNEIKVTPNNQSDKKTRFEENYNETTHASSSAYVEIKPINETVKGKVLKTDIELWVSPIPSLPGVPDQYPEMLSPNELFDHIHISNGQKYLISLKKDIVFDQGDSFAIFNKELANDVQTSQSELPKDPDLSFLFRSSSRDLMTFSAGSFVGDMLIIYHPRYYGMDASVFLTFTRGGELFSVRLFTVTDTSLPTISQMISMIKNHHVGSAGFDDYFIITPVFQSFSPRVIH